MANRVSAPNLFASTAPPWLLSSLDQNSGFSQTAFNDSSLGYVNGIPVDTGSANLYSVTLPLGSPSTYQDGMTVCWIPSNPNTGSSTITVSPLGAAAILTASGGALIGGEIDGAALLMVYKSASPTGFRIISTPGDPPGIVKMDASATVPAGYMACNGSAISRTTFSGLFSRIGTSYGAGNGSTTFNIPNLPAQTFPTGGTPGATGGSQTITVANMPAHAHPGTADTGHTHTLPTGGGPPLVQTGSSFLVAGTGGLTTGTGFAAITVASQGGGTAYIQPYLSFSFIIKVI